MLWTAAIKINLYQNGVKEKSMEKAWNSSWVKAYNIICETWSSVMHERAWLPVALSYWCLIMKWQKTEAAGWILKCIGIYSLPSITFFAIKAQIKAQSVHFKPYSLYNCNLNMFWSAAKIIKIVPVSKYMNLIWTQTFLNKKDQWSDFL